jgi:hypothetical protein
MRINSLGEFEDFPGLHQALKDKSLREEDLYICGVSRTFSEQLGRLVPPFFFKTRRIKIAN